MADMDSKKTNAGGAADSRAVGEAAAPAAGQAAACDPERLRALEEEIASLKDQNLRLVAETRNIQHRAQRDIAEALKYAEADFARELLLVVDDLVRTRDAAQKCEDVGVIGEGIRLVLEHFLKVLRSRGITPIEALGQPFDPHLHEAMLQQPSGEYPAGIVMQEIATGYKMHDRVLRSSRVVVSAGPGPAAAESEEPEAKSGE
jgi:molecular chaperone GrpE